MKGELRKVFTYHLRSKRRLRKDRSHVHVKRGLKKLMTTLCLALGGRSYRWEESQERLRHSCGKKDKAGHPLLKC